MIICLTVSGQGSLMYSCENCEMIEYHKIGDHTLTFGKHNWRMSLFDQQQVKCDEVDTHNSSINMLSVVNDSIFHLLGTANAAIGVIRNNKIVFKHILHSTVFDNSFLYNLTLFEDLMIGEIGSSREGPAYYYARLDAVKDDEPESGFSLFSEDIQRRALESTYITKEKRSLVSLIPKSETAPFRGARKSTLYQFAVSEHNFSMLDYNSNKFFLFNEKLEQQVKVILPPKRNWGYFYDYKTGHHYFSYSNKRKVFLHQLDIHNATLVPVLNFTGSRISSITDDRVYYVAKEKRAYSVYEVQLTGQELDAPAIEVDIPEITVKANQH